MAAADERAEEGAFTIQALPEGGSSRVTRKRKRRKRSADDGEAVRLLGVFGRVVASASCWLGAIIPYATESKVVVCVMKEAESVSSQ